jgi:hypothetical protein
MWLYVSLWRILREFINCDRRSNGITTFPLTLIPEERNSSKLNLFQIELLLSVSQDRHNRLAMSSTDNNLLKVIVAKDVMKILYNKIVEWSVYLSINL